MIMGMNEHRQQSRTTQAAEGLPRWRWAAAEIEELTQAGVFGEHDRFELIGGEIVPMSPKGARHEILRSGLAHRLSRLCPPNLWVTSEPQFNLDVDLYTVPDILVHPAEILVPQVRGPTALLVIEIADTSLSYDLEVKAPLYVVAGIPEYWVIDASSDHGPSPAKRFGLRGLCPHPGRPDPDASGSPGPDRAPVRPPHRLTSTSPAAPRRSSSGLARGSSAANSEPEWRPRRPLDPGSSR